MSHLSFSWHGIDRSWLTWACLAIQCSCSSMTLILCMHGRQLVGIRDDFLQCVSILASTDQVFWWETEILSEIFLLHLRLTGISITTSATWMSNLYVRHMNYFLISPSRQHHWFGLSRDVDTNLKWRNLLFLCRVHHLGFLDGAYVTPFMHVFGDAISKTTLVCTVCTAISTERSPISKTLQTAQTRVVLLMAKVTHYCFLLSFAVLFYLEIKGRVSVNDVSGSSDMLNTDADWIMMHRHWKKWMWHLVITHWKRNGNIWSRFAASQNCLLMRCCLHRGTRAQQFAAMKTIKVTRK